MSQKLLNFDAGRVQLVAYVNRLNVLRRTAAAAIVDGSPFVYFAIFKPTPPTGRHVFLSDRRGPIGDVENATPSAERWTVSARFRPAAVVAWCQSEAERIAG